MEKSVHYHNQLLSAIQIERAAVFDLSYYLYELNKNDTYEESIGIDNWFDYIAQPEIAITNAQANQYITTFKKLVVNNGFQLQDYLDIPFKSLVQIAKSTDPKKYKEDAKFLSFKDLKERMYEIKNDNKIERTYSYLVMKKCLETGNLSKVHGVDSVEIKNKLKINEDGLRNE